ncbi:capsid protein [Rhodobacteraceae phage LS06-2018-MD07]|jgi:hypothetical protein|nr:capsid protein [Rhodobacteraceae phage LS06-2018-MD07]
MIFGDAFSRNQNVGTGGAGTVVSTNVVDLGSELSDYGTGSPVIAEAHVGTAFAGGTSVQFKLRDSADNSTFADLVTSEAFPIADLPAGAVVQLTLPKGHRRYLRMEYVKVGTTTAGSVSAGLTGKR